MKTLALSTLARKELPATWSRPLAIGLFVLLLAFSAHARFFIPGIPAPLTLHTLFVFLGGALLRPKDSFITVAAHIGLGMAGLPVFALSGAVGFAYLTGVTGGYLIGFLLAAPMIGFLTRRMPSAGGLLLSLLLAEILILTLGAAHLHWIVGFSFDKALTVGVLPFIFGDVLKLTAAWTALKLINRFRPLRQPQ